MIIIVFYLNTIVLQNSALQYYSGMDTKVGEVSLHFAGKHKYFGYSSTNNGGPSDNEP